MRYRVRLVNPFGKTVKVMGDVETISTSQLAQQISDALLIQCPGMTTQIESRTLSNRLPLLLN